MILSLKNFPIFILMPLVLATSCSKTNSQSEANKLFEKRYGKAVKQQNLERIATQQVQEVMISTPPTEEELSAVNPSAPIENYYAYVDVSKFYEESPRPKFYEAQPARVMPDMESYEQTKDDSPAKSIPQNMFEIVYNTDLYARFRKIGYEFDQIRVPAQDAYGVKTALSDKPYALVGNDTLQKNIEKINSERTNTDIEISYILMAEQRLINQRNRMIRDFGEDFTDLLLPETSKKTSGKKAKKSEGLLDKIKSLKAKNNSPTKSSSDREAASSLTGNIISN